MINSFTKILLLLLISISCSMVTIAQESLSQNAKISILTCDPGSELYSTFGHTALRVQDPDQKMDVVFNYGIFDFKTPGFYQKFLRGKLDYMLGGYSFEHFIREYEYDKRTVTEQFLALDSLDKAEVFSFLKNNAKKENRYYKYDFFFDNCSTRARDLFDDVLGIKTSKVRTGKTFRNLLDEFLPGMVWADFGIDLVIGAVADDTTRYYDQTFLPDYLMYSISEHKLKNGEPLVKEFDLLLDFKDERKKRFTPPWFTPVKLFIGLMLLELLCFFFFSNDRNLFLTFYDKIWFGIHALASLVILFMWFGTDHMATKENWNLLWINPLFLFLLFLKSANRYRNLAEILLIGFLLICLTFGNVIPQSYHAAFAPIMVISILKILRSRKTQAIA